MYLLVYDNDTNLYSQYPINNHRVYDIWNSCQIDSCLLSFHRKKITIAATSIHLYYVETIRSREFLDVTIPDKTGSDWKRFSEVR